MNNETLDNELQALLDENFATSYILESCLALIKKGANPEVRGKLKGNTTLFLACSSVSIGFIRPLLELGSDVNQQNEQGLTPLLHSIWFRNIPMIKTVLEFNPDVHLKDVNGGDAFDLVSKLMGPNEENEVVELLNDCVLRNELASSQERSSSIEESLGLRR